MASFGLYAEKMTSLNFLRAENVLADHISTCWGNFDVIRAGTCEM